MTLMLYPWSFAYKKQKLSRLITQPVNEWEYEYQMPGDRLGNPRAVFNSDQTGARPVQDWEILGDRLYTNEKTVVIDYPFQTQEFAMPQYFVQLLKYMMAWHLAFPITEVQSKSEYWQVVAVGGDGRSGYLRQAMNIDGQGQPPKGFEDFSLIAARF
jgi:hypothetical protein